jgi:hypothetical protein
MVLNSSSNIMHILSTIVFTYSPEYDVYIGDLIVGKRRNYEIVYNSDENLYYALSVDRSDVLYSGDLMDLLNWIL